VISQVRSGVPIVFLSELRCYFTISPGFKGGYGFSLIYRKHYYESCQFASLQAKIVKLKHDLNLLGLPSNRIHHNNFFFISCFSIQTMFGILVNLRLSKPVSIGGLKTVNLEIQLEIYPALSTYIIALTTNIKITN
jgi:hypothetical protein